MKMEWDQVRFFLELSRCGALASAAARLGVNQTTVSRRIQNLEKELATPLFVRLAGSYTLTDSGRNLLAHAEKIESSFLGIERDILGTDGENAGVVRLGATEGYGTRVLTPLLAQLVQRHPHLRVDLLAVPRIVNLSRREADIVITLERPARGPYRSVRLTDYALGLYGAPEYLATHPPIIDTDDLVHHKFISYIDDLLFSKELQYLSDFCKPEQVVLRSTSVLAQHQATLAGMGLAVLPHFLGRNDTGLQPVLRSSVKLIRTFWMSMPMEIQDISRMRATWDFLRAAASQAQAAMMSTEPDPA